MTQRLFAERWKAVAVRKLSALILLAVLVGCGGSDYRFSSEESDSLLDWCLEHWQERSHTRKLFEWEIGPRPDCGRVVAVVKSAITGSLDVENRNRPADPSKVWARKTECVVRAAKMVIINSSYSDSGVDAGCPPETRDMPDDW